MAQRDPVGMIGLGIMGSAMSANLLRAGFPVVGHDIHAASRKEFSRSGGRFVRSTPDVAKSASIIITSLPSAAALIDVSEAIGAVGTRDQIVIETSTLPIPVKEQARATLAAHGVTLLDCPLSGTGAQAKAKDLAVYASGSRSAYRRTIPVLEGFARAHYFLGPFGAGSKMKFIANLLVAIHNVAAAEAIVLGIKAGLDPALVVEVVGDGAGASRMFQLRGPMMARGDYSEATMKVAIWQKDMQIISEFARELACPTPLFALTSAVYNAAMAQGHANDDTAAVCAVLESWAKTGRNLASRRARER